MKTVRIPLDPALSPQKNAAKYFKDYKKTYTAEQMLTSLTEKDRDELIYFDSVLDSIARSKTAADIAEIREELALAGYIKRQEQQIKEMRRIECKKIPADIDYTKLKGLRLEAVEKLSKIKPENLGQASRISGVNPADIAALNIILETL